MKTIITGDIHGKFGKLNDLINKKRPELIICCGDFGYWPNVSWCSPLSNIKLQGAKLLFCDGNHENHWALKERKSDELEKDIFYMPRGSTYILEDGRKILFMGGADSIYKLFRKIGIEWFPEEVITQKDFLNLPDTKIDIFISHTCPVELLNDMLKFDERKINDPSNHALSELWKIYRPSLWFFGHWHKYASGKMMGTNWMSLSAPGFGDQWWTWLKEK